MLSEIVDQNWGAATIGIVLPSKKSGSQVTKLARNQFALSGLKHPDCEIALPAPGNMAFTAAGPSLGLLKYAAKNMICQYSALI